MLGVGDHDVKHVGFAAFEHALECAVQVAFVHDAFAGDSEAFAHFDVVRVDACGVVHREVVGFTRVAQEGVAAVGFVEAVFPLHDHAEVLVVKHEGLGRDVFDMGAGEFLDVHDEGAVAVNVNDFFVGAGDFGADGRRVAKAHGAEAGGGDETAGFVVVVELAGPHLVLAHAGSDDGVALGHFPEAADGVLALDDVGGVLEFVGLVLEPFAQGGAPFSVACGVEGVFAQEADEASEDLANVGVEGDVDVFVFVDFGGVNIHVNDCAVLGEFFDFAGDAVVESHAEGKQEVGFVGGHVSSHGAVHAQPFQGEGMRLGKAADAHDGGGDGDAGHLGEGAQFAGGVGGDDAATDVEDGAFSVAQEADDFVEDGLVGFAGQGVAGQVHRHIEARNGEGLLDVFRDVDHDRAGASGGGDVEGFLDDTRDVIDVGDEVVVFDDGEGDAEDVCFLKCAAPNHVLGHLTGDGDEGHRVQPGVGDAGDEVGGTGAGGGHADAHFTAGTGVALCGEHASLFVSGQNGADFIGSRQGLVQLHACAAGVGEDGVNSRTFE